MPPVSINVRYYAKTGAALRLQQLDAERAAITNTFPDLSRAVAVPRKTRRTMSAAARAKIAAAARKRWAQWRKKKGA